MQKDLDAQNESRDSRIPPHRSENRTWKIENHQSPITNRKWKIGNRQSKIDNSLTLEGGAN